MRFERVDRQRLKHALFVAQFLFALAALADEKPRVLMIGNPTSHGWKVVNHPAFTTQVVDRDLEPRLAEAYSKFAAIMGIEGDPLYVAVTPHMEPFAASADPGFLDRAFADRERLIAEAGLAVRRFLIDNAPKPAPVELPLRDLARSARYDHIGGGFFRGTRDGLPLFDKSLADQARFALAYIDGWEASQDPLFDEVIRATLDSVLSDLQDRNGLFVAGHQAASLVARGGPELLDGGHFVWSTEELRHLLGPRVGEIVIFHYGAKDGGNVPGKPDFFQKNVLIPRLESETRAKFRLTEGELPEILKNARRKLLDVRSKRPKPSWHPKIVTSSNASMISALARAAVLFDEPRYATAAIRSARALRPATLTTEDHGLMVRALFDVYEATFDSSLIERALTLRPNATPEVPAAVAALAPVAPSRAPSLEDRKQIIIAGDPTSEEGKAKMRAARKTGAMIFLIDSERTRKRLAVWMPHVAGLIADRRQTTAVLCDRGTCRPWSE